LVIAWSFLEFAVIEEKTDASEKLDVAKEERQAGASGKPTMRVKVYTPFKLCYDEESYSVSGVNATGPFDILSHHHNFMTLLDACVLVIRPVEGSVREQKIRISGGLMHVKADKVIVFLDI
jgi:F0F1-type ATP synthase epsilon subunit